MVLARACRGLGHNSHCTVIHIYVPCIARMGNAVEGIGVPDALGTEVVIVGLLGHIELALGACGVIDD